MRIGIDAYLSSYELRGMGKYIVQLVSGVVTADQTNEYVIYGDPQVFPNLTGRSRVKFRKPNSLPYPLWEQVVLPLWSRQDRLELLHCPANTAPLILTGSIQVVVTIHDVMYLLPPSILSGSRVLRQRLGKFYRKFVVPKVSWRAKIIITVSEYSKREIVRYLKISPDRVRVIYEGIDPDFRHLGDGDVSSSSEVGREILNSPFILVLGAGDPRKNTLGAIRAYASCWREFPKQEKLVIVGMSDWRSSEVYRLVVELELQDRVFFAGYVSEQMLVRLYSSARCFLYPTLYEGFGLPPLEAMACGAPVITSDRTSVSEIVGDAAILIDPSSWEAIGNALVRLLQDETLRRRLIQQGMSRVQQYTWQSTVHKTLGVYAEMGAAVNV